jgi:hypothetical protein
MSQPKPQARTLAALVVGRPQQHSAKSPILNSNCAAIVSSQCRQPPARHHLLIGQRAASLRLPSAASAAALKSP